ncbi:MAG: NAD(P)-dependent oxidoreductase [Pedobacter sp.]|nr:MAG: NAD(P)-dependent oxidoreductase [Pedobacter sp.]
MVGRGTEVVAIARKTDDIDTSSALVTALAVDVMNKEQLTDAISGVEVVISAFNPGWSNPNIYDDSLAGLQAIQQTVKDAGVPRYIVIGGAGSLEINGQQLVDGPEFPQEIKPGASAMRDYLNILKEEKDLQWTFFSPAIEMHQGTKTGRTGKYRLGKDSPVFNDENRSILSVEDLSVVIADELENNAFPNQRFTAAY